MGAVGRRYPGDWESDDGPRADRAVLRRLANFDPSIYPVFRWWAMDQLTGRPLLAERAFRLDDGYVVRKGDRIPRAAWYIVKRCRDGVHRVLFTVQHFDNRVVRKLEADVARFLSAQQLEDRIDWAQQDEQEAQEKRRAEDVSDFVGANRSFIRDAMDGDLDAPAYRRDAKIMSYPGQDSRTSARDAILPTNKERGIEMPSSMSHEDEQE